MDNEILFARAAQLLAQADALVIGAGAGIGVDSGLPDFRSNDGFWNAYPALVEPCIDFADIANPRAFQTNPGLAWGFYGHRLALYRKTVPHDGFKILHRWSERLPLGARVFTSNVDGQFQKAGFSEDKIHEYHGSIHHFQCMNDECDSGIWSAEEFKPEVDEERCLLMNLPPFCPSCGEMARPNIVMFSDWNWRQDRALPQQRLETKWFESISDCRGNVVVVEIGAGTAIPSVRRFSHQISKEYGARIIRINTRESQVPSSQDVGIPAGSLEALKGIAAALNLLEPDCLQITTGAAGKP